MSAPKKTSQLDRIETAIASQRGFAHVDAEQQTRIANTLFGNGREGICDRLVRIEQVLLENAENSKRNSDGIEKLLTSITEIKNTTDEHHKSVHLSVLLPKPKFWVVICAAFVSLHFVSTYVPNVINLIFALLGYPGIKLPLM